MKRTLFYFSTILLSLNPVMGDELSDLKANYLGLPLVSTPHGIMLPVKINDHEAAMLVDSGAGSMVINLKAAKCETLCT